jgi:hypothetical protein
MSRWEIGSGLRSSGSIALNLRLCRIPIFSSWHLVFALNLGENTLSFDASLFAVPEPSTWAMLLLGFAGLGFVGCRRTRRAKPQAA